MRARSLTLACAGVLALAICSGRLAGAQDPSAAVSGTWKLNEAASLNPSGPGSQAGGRVQGSGLGFAKAGGEIGKEEIARFNGHLKMFRNAPAIFGIKATPKDVLIALDPDPAKGMAYKNTTDNKKISFPTPFGPVDIKAKWDGNKLHREIETAESLKLIEDYTPSADGKQLVVTVKVSNIMVRIDTVEIKRVYDRVQ